ncbi:glycerol-3-phosphate dehydrogenase/oxidase [Phycisphaerales bacterium AB-hyl4]|uniref:Glycerol-3-phosphate dehydrogenase/oxidase n=1 Tax=Natronomicrosphaera hydrolytica TaxID=3242702 RepID=A0ABV4U1R6_9BACT
MTRSEMLQRVQAGDGLWDFIIVGGGATGLGVAVDAASRGYRTLLLEQSDFAKGTSSRSTKLAHGGVRYLQQGNVSLVLEALRERGLMRQNAPHLVRDLPFVVPNYVWWDKPFYGVGLWVYDKMAGKMGFGRSRTLSREQTLERIPTVETQGLRGGVVYYDGQFDDARLAVNLAQTAAEQGAVVLNYMRVTKLVKQAGVITGVAATDAETGQAYEFKAKVVINATGVYTDAVRRMDDADAPAMIRPSQGAHIVLDRSFLPGDAAIMVPHTDDGRVLFAIPWLNRVMVGTTDTAVDETPLEPRPLQAEVDFLLSHAGRYLVNDPEPADVLSVFAGLRPLVVSSGSGEKGDKRTSVISRDHTIHISETGLVTVAGGKWTTYRKMAEDVVEQAASLAGLDMKPCVTQTLAIHGHHENAAEFDELSAYGADAPAVRELIDSDPAYGERMHANLPYRVGEAVWAARNEMARTVEDVLARRTRALLLDARASVAAAPKVAKVLAAELGHDDAWAEREVLAYTDLARQYVLPLA